MLSFKVLLSLIILLLSKKVIEKAVSYLGKMTDEKIPIVYSPKYNISFFGLEGMLHAFDSKKYGRVFEQISNKLGFTLSDCYEPPSLTNDQLYSIHTKAYINSLYTSKTSARIAEVPLLAMLPNYLIQTKLLNPMKLATSGTVLASKLALDHGWAINLSGGYHHAKTDSGSGFCFFADIPLAIHELFTHHGDRVKKVLIVDLDAHQGNGFQAAFTVKNFNQQPPSTWTSWLFSSPPQPEQLSYAADPRIDVLDMYNGGIYPRDTFAKQFITYDLPLRSRTRETEYLKLLRENLSGALDASRPDIVFYNAGTDIFEHDRLGNLGVSAEGIADRDEEVFRSCAQRGVPVVMTLSGGYTQESASIIADSLLRLVDRKVLPLPV